MRKFQELKISENKVSNQESEFILKPLERGFGNTLGNAMRRVLLSSITGIAPFALKIKGIQHQYQSIPGIVEDAVALSLNLKGISVKLDENIEDGEIIVVKFSGKSGEITTKDFTIDPKYTIIEKEEVLFNVSQGSEAEVEIELFLIKGRGYKEFRENTSLIEKREDDLNQISNIEKSGYIPMDSDFSPVKKVGYESIELNSASEIIEEELKIKITTNEVIDAKTAIESAANIFTQHIAKFFDVEELVNVFEEKLEEDETVHLEVQMSSIDELDLSMRSKNALTKQGILYIEELEKMSRKDIHTLKNIGEKSVNEIIEKLEKRGIILKED